MGSAVAAVAGLAVGVIAGVWAMLSRRPVCPRCSSEAERIHQ